MIGGFSDVVGYIKKTVSVLPSGTASRFGVSPVSFIDIDRASGARIDLELRQGKSRVFELNIQSAETEIVELGQAVPSSYTHRIPLRIRYDARGPAAEGSIEATAKSDQMCVIDAMHRGEWYNVSGIVHLTADAGAISEFNFVDDGGQEYSGVISETVITVSHNF